jgi:ribosomal protein S12 methylthiotransferase accessory factor
VTAGRAVFHLPQGTGRLAFPRGLPVAGFLERCDGATSYSAIRATLGSRRNGSRLDRVAAALSRAGALIDASALVETAWGYVENSTRFGGAPSERQIRVLERRATLASRKRVATRYRRPARFGMRRAIELRRSTRHFAEAEVAADRILALLWSAGGCVPARKSRHTPQIRRVVPSAGALYPLTAGLINFRSVAGLPRGVYLAHFPHDGAIGLRRVPGDPSQASRAFADPLSLRHAQGAIVLFGDFSLTANKYGNRAALLVTLEAGHAAQSAMLAATGLDIGTFETCGFSERRLRGLFGLGERQRPLSAIVFGACGKDPAPVSLSSEWLETEGHPFEPSFHSCVVTADRGKGETLECWGRSENPSIAVTKAAAEVAERMACASPRGLFSSRLQDVRAPLDPRTLVRYSADQYRRAGFRFAPFSEERVYLWKNGVDLVSGRTLAALAECVYFLDGLPAPARRRPVTRATSSGVAAYPTWNGATERAGLELIERDAFMRAWLLRETGRALRPRSLPARTVAELRRMRAAGIRTAVVLLHSEPAYVFMVFAQDEQRGFTKIGTAAAFDAGQALEQALMEVASHVAARVAHGPERRRMPPRSVRTFADHASLYAQPAYFRRADFLVPRSVAVMPKGRRKGGVDVLVEWARRAGRPFACVDLSPSGARGLKVVRVLVPGLLPVSFGFGNEPVGLAAAQGSLNPLVSGRNYLPHPFD